MGIILQREQCFQHGQLYVAASRVKQRENLRFLLPQRRDRVRNVVQHRLIDSEDLDEARNSWDSKTEKDCILIFGKQFKITNYSL